MNSIPRLKLYIYSILISFFLFISIISQIASSPLVFLDHWIFNYLTLNRSETWINIFYAITLFGFFKYLLFFTFIVAIIFWVSKKYFFLLPFIVGIVGSEAFVYLFKFLIARPRPDNGYYFESLASFPSGHAAASITFFGFIAFAIFQNTKSLSIKILSLAANLMIILLIGFSRLYLGVHFLSDVVAGYLLGIIWLITAILISKHYSSQKLN